MTYNGYFLRTGNWSNAPQIIFAVPQSEFNLNPFDPNFRFQLSYVDTNLPLISLRSVWNSQYVGNTAQVSTTSLYALQADGLQLDAAHEFHLEGAGGDRYRLSTTQGYWEAIQYGQQDYYYIDANPAPSSQLITQFSFLPANP